MKITLLISSKIIKLYTQIKATETPLFLSKPNPI